MRGPLEARTGPIRPNRPPGPQWHDCLRTFYVPKMIGSPCMNVVMLNFQAKAIRHPHVSEIFDESRWFARHDMRSSMGSQGFGFYRTRKLPEVPCKRGIISIIWQPMWPFVTSGCQSWIAPEWVLRISSCNESLNWGPTSILSTTWECEINSVSSPSLETTLKF